jgi:membrane-associated protease RseP (regulator of RpoE activity)
MPEFLPPVSSSSTTEYYRPVEVFVVHPPKQRYWLHIVLLLATIFTTLVVGSRMEFNYRHNLPAFYIGDDSLSSIFPVTWALQSGNILLGIPFSFTLMLILMAHEMGHYLCCRYYGVNATLPFFIPFPSLFGTMGAFIRIRAPIRSRAALFDIGIAGPIAGFSTALVVLLVALPLSRVALPSGMDSEIQLHYPLIFRLVWAMLPHGSWTLPTLHLHPTAVAAWVGMFATALNLLPGGQLDGGHIVFSIAPRAHKTVSRLTIIALIPMALYLWAGWLIWAVLLRVSGMRHPMVPEWPGVTGVRRWIAGFGLLMLVLTLAPAPVAHNSLMEILRAWRGQ